MKHHQALTYLAILLVYFAHAGCAAQPRQGAPNSSQASPRNPAKDVLDYLIPAETRSRLKAETNHQSIIILNWSPASSTVLQIEHWSLLGDGLIRRAVYLQGYESTVGNNLVLDSSDLYELAGTTAQHYIALVNQCHLSRKAMSGVGLDLSLFDQAGHAVLVGPDFILCSIEASPYIHEDLINWALISRFRDDKALLESLDSLPIIAGAEDAHDMIDGMYESHVHGATLVRGTPIILDIQILHAYLRLTNRED